jgi:hypothetical protein
MMNPVQFEARLLRARVRARGGSPGPPAPPGLRGRLTRLLESADLYPAELPPAAVLIVRRLRDPLPGRLAARPGALAVEPAWERAVRGALGELLRGAARPARQPVPAGAAAVVFDDEAEMLACLARDVALGRAAEHWWWRFGGPAGGTVARSGGWSVAAVLAAEPRLVPAVLAILAAAGDVALVLRAVAPAEADALTEGVCAALGVASPAPVPEEIDHRPPPRWLEPVFHFTDRQRLGPQRSRLLGVALAAHRAPAAVGTPAVRRAFAAWLSARAPLSAVVGEIAGRDRAAPAPAGIPAHPASPPGVDGRKWRASGGGARGPGDVAPAGAAATTAAPPHNQTASVSRNDATTRARPAVPPAATGPVTADVGAADFSVEDAVITELGGALYLVNIMRRLGLPGRFEPDWGLASRVGAWGTLDALARALLTPAQDAGAIDVAGDSLWPVLTRLAGRPATEPLGDGLMAPAGAGAASDGSNVSAPPAAPLLEALSPALRLWLDQVMPQVRASLEQILHPQDDAPSAPPPHALLLRRGRLFVTATHVDLVLPLSAVTVSIRRAGLDCDPGWAPEFGRVIKFYYV